MWKDYIHKTKNKPVSQYLIQAVSLANHPKTALDLGSGSGTATKYLTSHGFYVEAVDSEPAAGECLDELIKENKAAFYQQTFSDFRFKTYDLVHASYALPFISPTDFPLVWPKIKASLNPGGIFVAEFFGPQDSWNTDASHLTFHSLQEVEELLNGWQIMKLNEEKRQGPTAHGQQKL